ncbi:MAG: methyltransferase domain-containing protein [Myxococcota bacterium]|nr:methyltransferase domain-containing protein [Myxococcota bacterium]
MSEITRSDVEAHFTARAERYDRSSHWCTDPVLADRVLSLLTPQSTDTVVDVACGTGLVSAWFKGRVGELVGVDITEAMFEQARPRTDRLVVAPGEHLPFEDDTFEVAICRQGTQFMDDAAAIAEMARVIKPGGRVCVINLCAYGEEDAEEYFEILRWRNPVRRNFYRREDLQRLFESAGLTQVAVHDHISVEDVDAWSDNGAIPEARRESIRQVYRNASPAFARLHAVKTDDDTRFIDNMLFGIAIGVKAG